MKANKKLEVYFKDKLVGVLAINNQKKVAFEYDDEWIEKGFSISPFSLPLRKEVFVPSKSHFDGLFGAFADSLPDAWGQILVNRVLRKNNVELSSISVLDRLSIVGESGMGALTYRPETVFAGEEELFDLDLMAAECDKIINTEFSPNLDQIYRLGGTSGGARPKIMTRIDGEDWIIKFPARIDGVNSGAMEYDYALCAVECGIDMPEVRLFDSKECAGYFGVKRFDRVCGVAGESVVADAAAVTNDMKHGTDVSCSVHMLTVAALLELDFEQPSLEYSDLMKLTKILTGNNLHDMEQMFRRMCFNVMAHNLDDHAKNFSYIYDESIGVWRLSPAYDLTYSNTYFGEQTTAVCGKGKGITKADLLKVGVDAGLSKDKCEEIMMHLERVISDMLGKYLR